MQDRAIAAYPNGMAALRYRMENRPYPLLDNSLAADQTIMVTSGMAASMMISTKAVRFN